MKTKASALIALLSLFFYSISFSQLISGGGSGQSPAKSIGASEVTSGGFAGDVSLFTGTYNSSYTLGTVSTNSGISYTATLTHSSTYASRDNLPVVSGIPYGEGWNLDIPMISVSTEDYSKYSITQAYNKKNSSNPAATETYHDANANPGAE